LRRQNAFGRQAVLRVQLQQARPAEVPEQRRLERALHVAIAEGPVPLGLVDATAQLGQALDGDRGQIQLEALDDQLAQSGLVPDLQLQLRADGRAQAREERGRVRPRGAVDEQDNAVSIGHRGGGRPVLVLQVMNQSVAGVAVLDLEKIGRSSRPAHQHVGERAGCAQVDLTRHIDFLGLDAVVLDGVHTADVTADLLEEEPKLAEEVWVVRTAGQGHGHVGPIVACSSEKSVPLTWATPLA
jgi:hypothetical protein